uniref:Uncharacterized protein n=1 Tax=Anguilla anguilla TaxID=7936 RepID=A0A0E9ST81_ANGAN
MVILLISYFSGGPRLFNTTSGEFALFFIHVFCHGRLPLHFQSIQDL